MQNKQQALLFQEEDLPTSTRYPAGDQIHERKGKPRLRTVNRQQVFLREIDVERLIGADHEARALWAFIERIDKSKYYEGIRACEGVAGSPATDPQILISLWVYGYSKGISAGREIERMCEYNPAYQWLCGLEKINYHTLTDFRVKHKEALDDLFAQILGLLSAEGLITLERVVHDGSKVTAKASGDTFRREGRIQAHLELARKQIEAMGDPQNAQEVGPRVAKARERAGRERCEKLEKALQELEKIRSAKKTEEERKESRVSMTDPESRIMKHGGGGGYRPSYNMQISTDCAHSVIVGVGVSQAGADYQELEEAVARIESVLGKKPEQMVADGGFTSRENVLKMEERGVDYYGPLDDGQAQLEGQMKRRGVEEAFRMEHFLYDEKSNTYQCPAGKTLRYESREKNPGITHYRYRAKASDCQRCPLKNKCCPRAFTKGRAVRRGEEDGRVTQFREKMNSEKSKQIYRIRGPIAEFSNAWLKTKIGLRQFRVAGLSKAGMETLWACIAYNIAQWIRLRWRVRHAAA